MDEVRPAPTRSPGLRPDYPLRTARLRRCDPRNLPSARLLARLGMRCEAHFVHNELFKGEWGDELVYAILEHEWTASRHPAGPA